MGRGVRGGDARLTSSGDDDLTENIRRLISFVLALLIPLDRRQIRYLDIRRDSQR